MEVVDAKFHSIEQIVLEQALKIQTIYIRFTESNNQSENTNLDFHKFSDQS